MNRSHRSQSPIIVRRHIIAEGEPIPIYNPDPYIVPQQPAVLSNNLPQNEIPPRLYRGYAPTSKTLQRIPYDQTRSYTRNSDNNNNKSPFISQSDYQSGSLSVRNRNGITNYGTSVADTKIQSLKQSVKFLEDFNVRADYSPPPPAPRHQSPRFNDPLPTGRHDVAHTFDDEYNGFRCRVMMPAGGLEPEFIMIGLHGYGGSCDDLKVISKTFTNFHQLPVTWIFPEGDTILEQPVNGRAWFPLGDSFNILKMGAKFSAIYNSKSEFDITRRVVGMIESILSTWRLTSEQLGLIGFSQGAILASDVFMSMKVPPSLLGLFSGAPMGLRRWKDVVTSLESGGPDDLIRLQKLKTSRIIMVHGHKDYVVPRKLEGPMTTFFTEKIGSTVIQITHQAGHSMPNWTILSFCSYLRDWIQQRNESFVSGLSTLVYAKIIKSNLINVTDYKVSVCYGGLVVGDFAEDSLTDLSPVPLGKIPSSAPPICFQINCKQNGPMRQNEKFAGPGFTKGTIRNLSAHLYLPDDCIRDLIRCSRDKGLTPKSRRVLVPVMEPQTNEAVGEITIEIYMERPLKVKEHHRRGRSGALSHRSHRSNYSEQFSQRSRRSYRSSRYQHKRSLSQPAVNDSSSRRGRV